jgi:hypothetical protein
MSEESGFDSRLEQELTSVLQKSRSPLTPTLPAVLWVKVKIKFTLEQSTKAQRGSRGIAVLFPWPRRLEGWVVNATPRPLYLRERSGTPCIGGWLGPRAGLVGCRKSRPRDSIPGSSSPVASRCTDWAIPALPCSVGIGSYFHRIKQPGFEALIHSV